MTPDVIRSWAAELVRQMQATESDAAPSDFELGRYLGLGEALWLFQQQAVGLGLDPAELGLPSEDGISTALKTMLDDMTGKPRPPST